MDLQTIGQELAKFNSLDVIATACLVAMKLIHYHYKKAIKFAAESKALMESIEKKLSELEKKRCLARRRDDDEYP